MSRLEDMTRLDVLSQALMADLKSAVEDRIVAGMVEEFKTRARELVKKELESVTVAGVSRALDVMKMREQFDVRINFGGDDVVSHTL